MSDEIGTGMADRVDVAVIVVTYNSEAVVVDLLDSLPAALTDCSWRLVVVDNGSRDDTIHLIRKNAPDARIVDLGYNSGYAAGLNAGIREAGSASSYLILNPDVRLHGGCVAQMIERMEQRGAGIAVPVLEDDDGRLSYSLRREPNVLRSVGDMLLGSMRAGHYSRWGETITEAQAYSRETVADWATGAAMLISERCIVSCGLWDESFFLYSEETEYCLRARDRGFALIIVPTARAVHRGGESRTSDALHSLLLVNRVALYARTHSRASVVAFWLISAAREFSRLLSGRPASWRALRTMLNPLSVTRATVYAGTRSA